VPAELLCLAGRFHCVDGGEPLSSPWSILKYTRFFLRWVEQGDKWVVMVTESKREGESRDRRIKAIGSRQRQGITRGKPVGSTEITQYRRIQFFNVVISLIDFSDFTGNIRMGREARSGDPHPRGACGAKKVTSDKIRVGMKIAKLGIELVYSHLVAR
jgi:hypothetical protein